MLCGALIAGGALGAVAVSAAIEGTEFVQEFRIEGDDLLILTRPGSKFETRFRRAHKE